MNSKLFVCSPIIRKHTSAYVCIRMHIYAPHVKTCSACQDMHHQKMQRDMHHQKMQRMSRHACGMSHVTCQSTHTNSQHTHTHTTHTHTHTHTHKRTCACTNTHACQTRTHACTHACVRAFERACTLRIESWLTLLCASFTWFGI